MYSDGTFFASCPSIFLDDHQRSVNHLFPAPLGLHLKTIYSFAYPTYSPLTSTGFYSGYSFKSPLDSLWFRTCNHSISRIYERLRIQAIQRAREGIIIIPSRCIHFHFFVSHIQFFCISPVIIMKTQIFCII
jgi:hypothetical protein